LRLGGSLDLRSSLGTKVTWFTRSDILEIFRDAQDMLARRAHEAYSAHPKLQKDHGDICTVEYYEFVPGQCLYCCKLAERTVLGLALCDGHANKREASARGTKVYRPLPV
jgi:hypothetical protein